MPATLSVQNRHALRRPKNFRSDEAPAAPARGSLPEAAGEEGDDVNEVDLIGGQLLENVEEGVGEPGLKTARPGPRIPPAVGRRTPEPTSRHRPHRPLGLGQDVWAGN